MSRRRPFVSLLTSAAAGLAVTACTGPAASPPAAPSPQSTSPDEATAPPRAATSTTTSRRPAERIAAIETALDQPRPGTTPVSRSGPELWAAGGRAKNQDDSPHPPGVYELSLYCAGSGTITVGFTVGGTVLTKQDVACADAPAPVQISSVSGQVVSTLAVEFTGTWPDGAVIGYVVTHAPPPSP